MQRAVVHGVEERLDAESVTRREESLILLIPQRESELAAQLMQAVRSEILVQMERDLAVGAGAQAVAARLELTLDSLIVVELPVHDDMSSLILAGDRLITGTKIDDAESRVSEPYASVRRDPGALAIGPALDQSTRRTFEIVWRDGSARRKQRDDAAHGSSWTRLSPSRGI